MNSMSATSATIAARGLPKWPATRLRIESALPT
jgi:hypothetical protein